MAPAGAGLFDDVGYHVAPADSDIFHPDAFVGLTNGTYPEREASAAVLDVRLVDPCLAERLVTTWIDHVERGGERPSDHAALIADLALTATSDSAGDPVRTG